MVPPILGLMYLFSRTPDISDFKHIFMLALPFISLYMTIQWVIQKHKCSLTMHWILLSSSYMNFREYLAFMSDVQLEKKSNLPISTKFESYMPFIDEQEAKMVSKITNKANTNIIELNRIRAFGVNNKSYEELQRYHSQLMSALKQVNNLDLWTIDIAKQIATFSNISLKEKYRKEEINIFDMQYFIIRDKIFGDLNKWFGGNRVYKFLANRDQNSKL